MRPDLQHLPFLTVDCDGHIQEHKVRWEERLPKQYFDLAPRWVMVGNRSVGFIEQKSQAQRKEDILGTGPPLQPKPRPDAWVGREGEWDPHKRIPDMDYEGIDVGVCFGSSIAINGLVSVEDPGLAVAIAQAYNDWVAKEFCAAYPHRLKGIAALPLQDPQAAAQRELREEIFNKRFESESRKFLEEIRKQAMIEYK